MEAVAGEGYTTKELSRRTWPDFERLFSQGGGWDFCACMLTQRGCHLPDREYPARADHLVRNHQEKRQLVGQVRAERGSFGNVSTSGTVSMFERQGFTAVEVIANTRVLMRKHL